VSRVVGKHFLVVATEWGSTHGGLSTFNRQLCVYLAAAGVRVSCLVLDAPEKDREDAAVHDVQLVEASRRPGLEGNDRLYLRPKLGNAGNPDVIVGHARITGPAAQVHCDNFPGARRLHFLHMIPDDIERYKPDDGPGADSKTERRHETELELCEGADYAVAVGPRIHDWFLRDLGGRGVDTGKLLKFVPGFETEDPGPRSVPGGRPWMVLLFCRAEDEDLKGLDIAAAGFSRATANIRGRLPDTELVLRGALEGVSRELVEKARTWAEDKALHVRVKPYTDQPKRLAADLRSTSLVLMPSRAEGFGLAGVEAIVARTPVLVSSSSGLGMLLDDVLPTEQAVQHVVETTPDDEWTRNEWARAIERVLIDREWAFHRAGELQQALATTMTWRDAVSGLLKAIGMEDTPHRSRRAGTSRPVPRKPKGRLLIVEDEIGEYLVRTLSDYECKLLPSFEEAMDFFQEDNLAFDLAIVDRHLKRGMNDDQGLQILDYLRDCTFPRLLMTIDPPAGLAEDVEKKYQARLYKKNNTNTDIRAVVRKLLCHEC
jgi:glycosyltransferase involved in cell wall biosynthesis